MKFENSIPGSAVFLHSNNNNNFSSFSNRMRMLNSMFFFIVCVLRLLQFYLLYFLELKAHLDGLSFCTDFLFCFSIATNDTDDAHRHITNSRAAEPIPKKRQREGNKRRRKQKNDNDFAFSMFALNLSLPNMLGQKRMKSHRMCEWFFCFCCLVWFGLVCLLLSFFLFFFGSFLLYILFVDDKGTLTFERSHAHIRISPWYSFSNHKRKTILKWCVSTRMSHTYPTNQCHWDGTNEPREMKMRRGEGERGMGEEEGGGRRREGQKRKSSWQRGVMETSLYFFINHWRKQFSSDSKAIKCTFEIFVYLPDKSTQEK